MIASMPEGDDKPLKYPAMFADSDVVIINKVDLQPYIDFNEKAFRKVVTGLNPDVIIFPVSCKTGMGLEAWFTWLDKSLKAKKNK
jgi:hydrogenase nickel incorporation protein HypB